MTKKSKIFPELALEKPKKRIVKKKEKLSFKLTEDNMIAAINEYIRVFNAGTPRSLGQYILPSEMSMSTFRLHFAALKAAFDVVIKDNNLNE